MASTRTARLVAALAGLALVAGCSGRDTGTLPEAPISTDPVVFDDDFNGVEFRFFGDGAIQSGLDIDRGDAYEGDASLRMDIPGYPDWTGGAFPSNFVRDLTGYTGLTFWAKASQATTFDVVGLGNDNTGTSLYIAEWPNVQLTPTWTKYIVPIPLPERLSLERGMFYFADAVPPGGSAIQVWFDEVRYEDVSGITDPRPLMSTRQIDGLPGTSWSITGTQTTFSVNGEDQLITHSAAYFDFTSSDEEVATVRDGIISIVGTGSAEITATFGGLPVPGTVTVVSEAPPPVAAPPPTLPPERVISLFSNPYQDVLVDRWTTGWDTAEYSDLQIQGNDTKLYQLSGIVGFAAIEFVTETIDATAMTHVHLDVWAIGGTQFKVKLVNFTADGQLDSQDEITRTIATDEWVGVEIPLSEFTDLTGRDRLAQMLLSGIGIQKFYVDNIYFHD